METQINKKAILEGKCTFCGATFTKNKISQHLKFCKSRQATIAEQEKKSHQPKTRLFHILAEGRYNPQYWLHFEVSASESLWDIDSFLKDMWIDDLDHLSGFTINGTDYSDNYPDEAAFSFTEVGDEEEEEEEKELSEEEAEKELKALVEEYTSQFMQAMALRLRTLLDEDQHRQLTEWVAEINQPRSHRELIDFLKEEQTKIEKEKRHLLRDGQHTDSQAERKIYFKASAQRELVRTLLEAVEDRSMDVSLEDVLKIGQKFSYVYDFGSSTYINLKVIAEREGIVQNKKKPVQLLAQNIAPTFACTVCGKPATQVEMGYFTQSIAESAFCTSCAKKQYNEEGSMLPIINSPRVGVL